MYEEDFRGGKKYQKNELPPVFLKVLGFIFKSHYIYKRAWFTAVPLKALSDLEHMIYP